MTFDRTKVHPYWAPGAGFFLRAGDGLTEPTTSQAVERQILGARFARGDKETDRLTAELQGLLAIRARYNASPNSGAVAEQTREEVGRRVVVSWPRWLRWPSRARWARRRQASARTAGSTRVA